MAENGQNMEGYHMIVYYCTYYTTAAEIYIVTYLNCIKHL
jgi:hypothetical protein